MGVSLGAAVGGSGVLLGVRVGDGTRVGDAVRVGEGVRVGVADGVPLAVGAALPACAVGGGIGVPEAEPGTSKPVGLATGAGTVMLAACSGAASVPAIACAGRVPSEVAAPTRAFSV